MSGSEALHYQLFIEPKGQQLLKHDDRKEDSLRQIEGRQNVTVTFPNRDFKEVGLLFYNTEVRKRVFEEAFGRVLL